LDDFIEMSGSRSSKMIAMSQEKRARERMDQIRTLVRDFHRSITEDPCEECLKEPGLVVDEKGKRRVNAAIVNYISQTNKTTTHNFLVRNAGELLQKIGIGRYQNVQLMEEVSIYQAVTIIVFGIIVSIILDAF
jgi:hypothetical protein